MGQLRDSLEGGKRLGNLCCLTDMIEGGKGVVEGDKLLKNKQSSNFSAVICIGECRLHNGRVRTADVWGWRNGEVKVSW